MSCHTLHIMSKCMVQRLNFAFPCHTPCMLCFNKSVAYSKCHTLAIVGGIGTSSQLQITTPPPLSGSLLTSDPHCHSNGPILKWREFPPLLETGLEDVIALLPLVPTLTYLYISIKTLWNHLWKKYFTQAFRILEQEPEQNVSWEQENKQLLLIVKNLERCSSCNY